MKLLPIQSFIVSFFLVASFVSCGGDDTAGKENNDNQDDIVDTLSMENDSLLHEMDADTLIEATYETEEDELAKLNAETPQLTFCDCVKMQKKLDDKMEVEEDDDKLMDILDEMERMVNNECKILLVGANTTPDERKAHERKVNKCLKN